MKKKRKIIVNTLIVISILTFVYGAGMLFYQQYQRNKSNSYTEQIYEGAEKFSLDSNIPFTIDFQELQSQYPDVIAWIYSEDTQINNPIAQGESNDTYIHSLLDGSYNIAGTLFIDENNSPDFSDYMTIIYGHNMKNDSMFGSLSEYKDQQYYQQHSKLYLFLPEGTYYLEVIGAMIITETSSIYTIPETLSGRDATYYSFVQNGYYNTGVSLQPEDKMVLLSTCCDWDSTLRFVVLTKISEIPLGQDNSVTTIFGESFNQ